MLYSNRMQLAGEDSNCLDYSVHLGGFDRATRCPDSGSVTIGPTDLPNQAQAEETIDASGKTETSSDQSNELNNKNVLLGCDSVIELSSNEFKDLMALYSTVQSVVPELKGMIPCSYYHENQMSFYTCPECCPEGLSD